MPNIKSAKKRVNVIKTADVAVASNADNKQDAIKFAIKKVDQACAKGIYHKNKAARKKSQLMKQLNG